MTTNTKADAWIGRVIADRYRITSVLGSGGMGHVFSAHQATLNREVAVKVIRRHLTDNEEAVARFIREAQIVAKLNHPNIVTVHDFGRLENDGGLYIVMEKIEGKTLAELTTGVRMPWQSSLGIIREVASALATAHKNGVIHRDLKPDNIIVSKSSGISRVKVLDFGVAKLTESSGETHLTGSGILLGTPGYMAPELIMHGVTDDPRSDIFALGLIWLELLLGHRAYKAETPTALLVSQVNEEPPQLLKVAPELNVPPELQNLLYLCAKKDPNLRPESAEKLVRLIDALGRALGVSGLETPEAGTAAFAPPTAVRPMTMPLGSMTAAALAPAPFSQTQPPGAPVPTPEPAMTTPTPQVASATSAYAQPPVSAPHPSTLGAQGQQPPGTGPYVTGGMQMPSGAYPPPNRTGWVVFAALGVGLIVGAAVIAAFMLGRGSNAVVVDDELPPMGDKVATAAAEMPKAAEAPPVATEEPAKTAPDEPAAAAAKTPPHEEKETKSKKSDPPEVAKKSKDTRKAKSRRKSRRSRDKSASAKSEEASSNEAETAKVASAPPPEKKAALSSKLLTGAIRGNFGPATQCANTNITQHPKKQIGLMVDHCPSYAEIAENQSVSMTVDENGKVVSARFASREANTSKIGRCVLASLRGWSFPEFENAGESATFKRPIRFQECGPINGKCVFDKPRY